MKIKYQYTYFISPFKIDETQYDKYIFKLVKNTKLKLKIYKDKKNEELNNYFTDEIKDIMFQTINMSETEQKELENISENNYKQLLKLNAVCFEYLIENNTQAKMGQEDGIFFKIDKIEVICFKNGIGFILLKTYLEENTYIENVLDFNYKFKQINSAHSKGEVNEKISIQTNEFKDRIEISELFKELTGKSEQNEIYTFSYLCVDGEDWNVQNKFDEIEEEFTKLVNVIPYDKKVERKLEVIDISNYAKIGITPMSTALITNSLEVYNCTKLPFEYENQYLYTLIWGLYQKAILEKVRICLKQKNKHSEIKRAIKLLENQNLCTEITKEKMGSIFFGKIKEQLSIETAFKETFNKYYIVKREEKIRKNKRNNIIIWSIIAICIITNIINLMILKNITI